MEGKDGNAPRTSNASQRRGKTRYHLGMWESMAEHPERIPVPDWQLKELERRIEAQQKDPQPGQTWAEVKREIRHGKWRANHCTGTGSSSAC